MPSCKNQLNMKYYSKLLVSNICHIEIIICIFALENLPYVVKILGGIPYQEI